MPVESIESREGNVERTARQDANRIQVPGVLLLYEDPLNKDATTVREHVDAFSRHSRFAWYPLNVTFGLPPALARYEFAAVVFHYSLRPTYHWLEKGFRPYLAYCAPYKIAIFQDEIWYFREREQFLTEFQIDCLYSRHKPHHVRDVYGYKVPVNKFIHYLAGYVSDDLIERSNRLAMPFEQRPIDVGYRGRRLPFHFGRGGQEKGEIAERFAALTADRGLKLDVASRETDRLYGEDWDRFLASCKAMLGVEGGVSIVDPTGRFRAEYERMIRAKPDLTYSEYAAAMGPEFDALEDRIDYRSMTPRHFESAAFRNLQILYEGRYDGILKPWEHYVPLRKDFSNLSEVLAVLADPATAKSITDRAHADLIASGKYSYQRFIQSFDAELIAGGVPEELRPTSDFDRRLRATLGEWARFRSRVRDFDDVCYRRSIDHPEEVVPISLAQVLVREYQPIIERRDPVTWTGLKGWCRQARDRYLWRLVEHQLGHLVPARAEFDPRPSRLNALEWCAVAPAWQVKSTIKHMWRTARRRFWQLVGMVSGSRKSVREETT